MAKIASRVNPDGTGKKGCPACSGREVTEANCLETKSPQVAAQLVRVLRSKTLVEPFRALRDKPREREAWVNEHADPSVPAGREGAKYVTLGSGALAVWRCTSGEGGCGGHEWVAQVNNRKKNI